MATKLTICLFLTGCCLLSSCTTVSQRTNRAPSSKESRRATVSPEMALPALPPRTLTEAQRRLLIFSLREGFVGKVKLVYEEGDQEAANFASQITTALLLAGEDAELHAIGTPSTRGHAPLRLLIRVPTGPAPPAHGDSLLHALDVAHLPWEPAIAMGNPAGLVTITVGAQQIPPD